ncbi:DNA binding protein [Rhodococcus phage Reynauld]|uniref:DNA binding protein n=1 Tax=Rhodococcus phage Reynauld TaxID=3062845 RepID=A0ACD4UH81_9CAUD|nr:DNA binding protein [Rhodococcus phage Reynauld]
MAALYPLAKAWDGTMPKFATFNEMPTGRRARGQLDDMVDVLCKMWMLTGTGGALMPEMCTSEWLTERTAAADGRETSPGAVAGILHRWRRIGYAIVRDKPLRFCGFTAAGLELGVEELNRQYRRRKLGDKQYQWDSPTG